MVVLEVVAAETAAKADGARGMEETGVVAVMMEEAAAVATADMDGVEATMAEAAVVHTEGSGLALGDC